MLDHKQFRIELAKQLLGDADGHTNPPSRRLNALPPVARLTERHFIEKVPPCTSGRTSQPVCVACSNKRGRGKKTTTYQCKQCKLPMCVIPCFELYHTKVDPVRHLDQMLSLTVLCKYCTSCFQSFLWSFTPIFAFHLTVTSVLLPFPIVPVSFCSYINRSLYLFVPLSHLNNCHSIHSSRCTRYKQGHVLKTSLFYSQHMHGFSVSRARLMYC